MSLAITHSCALVGTQSPKVRIEVHLAAGLPQFQLVGRAVTEVRECRERVRSALQSSGFHLHDGRITVNLAPADLPKHHTFFDLGVAVGMLAASGQLQIGSQALAEQWIFAAELSLTGALAPCPFIPALIAGLLSAERARQSVTLVIPASELTSAQHMLERLRLRIPRANELQLLGAQTLKELVEQGFSGKAPKQRHVPTHATHATQAPVPAPEFDLADVVGQSEAIQALEVAAAGAHHLLLVGSPGAGKTLLARTLPSLLPEPVAQDQLDLALIHAARGLSVDAALSGPAPFRQPHHSTTRTALLGGGTDARPGEVSLAHGGVLFLDELTLFHSAALDGLREPLESGFVQVSRNRHTLLWPARFQLIAAMNPCACGYLGSTVRACTCRPEQRDRHWTRLSGPILDRIDLACRLEAPAAAQLLATPSGQTHSREVAARVTTARNRAMKRQGCLNAQLSVAQLQRFAALEPAAQRLVESLAAGGKLSARGIHRLLRVARTLADLDPSSAPDSLHAQAIAVAAHLRRPLAAPL